MVNSRRPESSPEKVLYFVGTILTRYSNIPEVFGMFHTLFRPDRGFCMPGYSFPKLIFWIVWDVLNKPSPERSIWFVSMTYRVFIIINFPGTILMFPATLLTCKTPWTLQPSPRCSISTLTNSSLLHCLYLVRESIFQFLSFQAAFNSSQELQQGNRLEAAP